MRPVQLWHVVPVAADQSARATEKIAEVEEIICSQEDNPGTSKVR